MNRNVIPDFVYMYLIVISVIIVVNLLVSGATII